MKEIWKDIPNFENYKISNTGRIIAKARYSKWRNKNSYTYNKEKELKLTYDKDGYLKTALRDDLGKRHYFRVHRLVCITFLKNPNNYPVVNHKDGVKSNNHLNNLEWCSISQNTQHGFDVLNRKVDGSKYHKKIKLYDLNYNFISEFNSYDELAKHLNITKLEITSYLQREKRIGIRATLLKKYRAKV